MYRHAESKSSLYLTMAVTVSKTQHTRFQLSANCWAKLGSQIFQNTRPWCLVVDVEQIAKDLAEVTALKNSTLPHTVSSLSTAAGTSTDMQTDSPRTENMETQTESGE